MVRGKIIELLNMDLRDEHGAIIQYLAHAYAIGEGEVACEIESFAREEMRHMDWLAEIIVSLGGKPSLDRGTMNMTGKSVPTWMANDVGLEQGAIDQYKEHISLIKDPDTKRLLKRILADEKAHKAKFEHLVEKTKKEGLKDIRGSRKDSTARTLNWGINHEYTVILQYLFHSYMTKKAEAKKQFEDQAVNEMQHMGWLAEELAGGGGSPVLDHVEVDRSVKTADMLKVDISIEKQVVEKYARAAGETKDPGLKALFRRIRDNEKYHLSVFTDLLEQEQKK